MKYLALAIAALCIPPLHAQSEIPEIVTKGLTEYQKQGRGPAVALWLKGSPRASDTASIEAHLESDNLIGFEPVVVVSIAPSLRRVYIMLKHESGPLFLRFDCYKLDKDWIVLNIRAEEKAEDILPARVLGSD